MNRCREGLFKKKKKKMNESEIELGERERERCGGMKEMIDGGDKGRMTEES